MNQKFVDVNIISKSVSKPPLGMELPQQFNYRKKNGHWWSLSLAEIALRYREQPLTLCEITFPGVRAQLLIGPGFSIIKGKGLDSAWLESDGIMKTYFQTSIPTYRAKFKGECNNLPLLAWRPSSGLRYSSRDAVLDVAGVSKVYYSRMSMPWHYEVRRQKDDIKVMIVKNSKIAILDSLEPFDISILLLFHFSGLPFATSRWAYVQI